MIAPAYSVFELLRDGRRLEIRALRPSDRDGLLAAVDRASDQSFYRRFFGVRRDFTEKEIERFLHIDFVDHVALVAVMEEGGAPVIAGGARYVVVEPGRAEVAFTVVDQYQGQGIGAALMRHLIAIARAAGLRELLADVLPDNAPMLGVFKKSGTPDEHEARGPGGAYRVAAMLRDGQQRTKREREAVSRTMSRVRCLFPFRGQGVFATRSKPLEP